MVEIIHQNRKANNNNGYMLELDFENANNMLDLEYLLEVLAVKRFGDK